MIRNAISVDVEDYVQTEAGFEVDSLYGSASYDAVGTGALKRKGHDVSSHDSSETDVRPENLQANARANPQRKPLRVAFLVGADSLSTRMSIEAVCHTDSVEPVGIFLDTANTPFSRRVKNFRRNLKREGLAYAGHRFLEAVSDTLDKCADRVIPRREVEELLREAFPGWNFTLSELSEKLRCPLLRVGNLNGPEAIARLRACAPDLGIVLGTRILKHPTFSVPSLGCLNLHKGAVPEFRGMPPGFWELYEGAETAGVTVHFVNEGLDAGDIVGSSSVAIHPNETEHSLRVKLDQEGARLLAECVSQLHSGAANRRPQPPSNARPRTRPTRHQRQELANRRPGSVQLPNPLKNIGKTAFYLGLYYSGVFTTVRWLRRTTRRSRAAVLLYHRVNDFSIDPLTTSGRAFAEHLVIFRRYYEVRDSDWLIHALRAGKPIPSRSIAIHFDDCYKDVFSAAAPLLQQAKMPACAFISTGFIGTDRAFQHDVNRYPFVYENLTADEVRLLPARGVSIGAHTVNHVDLSKVSPEDAPHEVIDCKHQLEALTSHPVTLFSFPFGKKWNIREDVRRLIRTEYQALFSAYGGFVNAKTHLYDVPRVGVSSTHRPLYLMMELEGLSPTHWLRGARQSLRLHAGEGL